MENLICHVMISPEHRVTPAPIKSFVEVRIDVLPDDLAFRSHLKHTPESTLSARAVAHEMLRIVYFMLRDNEPYRGQNVEMTSRKLKSMKYRASVGLRP